MRKSKLLYITENVSDLLNDEQIIGNYVYDIYDEDIGRVAGLLVEKRSFFPRYLVYMQGGVLGTHGKTILVPKGMYNSNEFGKIQLLKSVQWIQDMPCPDDIDNLMVEEEELVLDYFSLPLYWDEETTDDTDES